MRINLNITTPLLV